MALQRVFFLKDDQVLETRWVQSFQPHEAESVPEGPFEITVVPVNVHHQPINRAEMYAVDYRSAIAKLLKVLQPYQLNYFLEISENDSPEQRYVLRLFHGEVRKLLVDCLEPALV